MKHSQFRRLMALTLLTLMLLAFAAPALAAEYVQTNQSVAVRASASSAGTKLGTLKKGEVLEKLGVSGNWTRIDYNGTSGYVLTKYTKAATGGTGTGTGTGSGTGATVQVTSSTLNVRNGPGTSYAKLGSVKKGATFTKVGETGSWTIVEWNNGVAYVFTSYVKVVSGGTNPAPSDTQYLYATADNTAVRRGPGTSYTAIGYLDAGDRLEYIGTSGAWYMVQFGSRTGYVYGSSAYISGSGSGSSASGTVYAKSSTRVYKSPSTSASSYGYLYQGESAERIGVYNSTWTMINYEGYTGYVLTSRVTYIAGSPLDNAYSVNEWWYAKAKTYCYSVPYVSTDTRTGYLSKGESVYVLSANSNWAMIDVEGTIMYCDPDSLSSSYVGGNGSASDDVNFLMPNQRVYIKYDTPAYGSYSSDTLFTCDTKDGAGGIQQAVYGYIMADTSVVIQRTITNGRYYIRWYDDRPSSLNVKKYFEAFVNKDDLTTRRP